MANNGLSVAFEPDKSCINSRKGEFIANTVASDGPYHSELDIITRVSHWLLATPSAWCLSAPVSAMNRVLIVSPTAAMMENTTVSWLEAGWAAFMQWTSSCHASSTLCLAGDDSLDHWSSCSNVRFGSGPS
ncbi:BQ5605_C037g11624 [Microbotryum silenes-dioicae]|uniref:BQ5605_C037g11624 protein n=1 Tax=Microbotryum silenes-dioicae TaxID=796604 RepID=A0A2X0PAA1_9BASI|nr:BQ5605_C037g11624 [Microbotryum silenes-dioicae]